jgi:Ca2+-binding EF-hand superfamily protein
MKDEKMERVSLESFLREFLERASGESFWRELLERVSESVEDFLDWLSS